MLGRRAFSTAPRCTGHGQAWAGPRGSVPFGGSRGIRHAHRPRVAESLIPGVDNGVEVEAKHVLSQALKADAFAPAGHPDHSSSTWVVGQPTPDQLHANGQRSRTQPSSSSSSSNPASTTAAEEGDAAAAAAAAAAAGVATSLTLHQELQECSCARDVLDIVEDEHQIMSAHNTATALQRLVKLSAGQPKAAARQLLSTPAFIHLLQLLQRHAPGMNPFQLVTSYYNAARLGAPLSSLPALLERLDAALEVHMGQLNGRDVADILHAWATLRHKPSDRLASRLCARGATLIEAGECSAQSVSMMLWALATARLATGGGALPAAAAAALAGPLRPQLQPQGWANSLWGLSKLERPSDALLAAGCEQVARDAPTGTAASSAASSSRGSKGRDRQGGERPWQLQEVLNVLWAAAAARHHPGRSINGFIAHCTARVEATTPADIASLFHSLGVFGHRPSPAELEVLLPRAAALLPRMSTAEVASLYWGLGMMRATDNPLFLQLTSTTLPGLWASQQLGPVPTSSSSEGEASTSSSSSTSSSPSSSRAGSRAGNRRGTSTSSSSSKVSSSSSRVTDSLKRQAFQGYLAGKLEGVPGKWPAPLLGACREAWCRSAGAAPPSKVVAELRALAKQLGVLLAGQGRTQDGLVELDLALQATGERLVVVQVLLPHDVASNSGELLAPVRWQRDILERNGFDEVHFLPAADYQRVPLSSRPQFLSDLLRRLGINVRRDALTTARQQWGWKERQQQGQDQQQQQQQEEGGSKPSASSGRTTWRAADSQPREEAGSSGGGGGWGELSSSQVTVAEAGLLLGGAGEAPGAAAAGGRQRRAGGRPAKQQRR